MGGATFTGWASPRLMGEQKDTATRSSALHSATWKGGRSFSRLTTSQVDLARGSQSYKMPAESEGPHSICRWVNSQIPIDPHRLKNKIRFTGVRLTRCQGKHLLCNVSMLAARLETLPWILTCVQKAFLRPLPSPHLSLPPSTPAHLASFSCPHPPRAALPNSSCSAFSFLLSYLTPPHPFDASPCVTSSGKSSLTPEWAISSVDSACSIIPS